MKEKTVKLYQFNEIQDENLIKKILNNYSNINIDYEDWYHYTLEHYTEELEKIGLHSVKIEFSGFFSQGDGACFTGRYNMPSILKRVPSDIPSVDSLRVLLEKIGKNHEFYFNIIKNKYCNTVEKVLLKGWPN